ncbi:HutD family protein [Paraburkholderia sp. JHI2823]|uniref:HutD family protein n=1 Tax=Paraburkholderia sp. JHI2823 TaxID=3112960 RepID=UPI00316E40FB
MATLTRHDAPPFASGPRGERARRAAAVGPRFGCDAAAVDEPHGRAGRRRVENQKIDGLRRLPGRAHHAQRHVGYRAEIAFGELQARAGQPVHFSGDLYMWANAPGQPVSVLNVMCRRGVARARVMRGVTLAPLHVLWISGRSEELALRPSAPGAQLASVAIDLLDEDASRP